MKFLKSQENRLFMSVLWREVIKLTIITVCLILIYPGQGIAKELTVAAAANLQGSIQDIVELFQRESGVSVQVIMGSSGKLTAQIEHSAPFDLFLSADMKYPQALFEEGLAMEAPKVYAYGALVLWSLKDINLSTVPKSLTDARIKHIALADPQLAPYGREAVNVLKHYSIYQSLQKKLVYGQNISQVNDFILTQSADIGFSCKSSVLSTSMKTKGHWIEVPKETYQRISQGCVILKHSQKGNLDAARKFYDFLFTPQAKQIFMKYGYTVDE